MPLSSMIGVTKLEVYDAVGNKSEIDLTNVLCIITYAYVNQRGDRMVVNVQDTRGITKLGIMDEQERIIEVFGKDTMVVRRQYARPVGVRAIEVHSHDGNVTEWDQLLAYSTAPTVVGNKVYSPIGIGRIVYDDSNEIEFRKDTPIRVMVDLQEHRRVQVYDTLGNMAVVERS